LINTTINKGFYMENVVPLIKSQQNELEFDITIQGIKSEEPKVRFVIEASPILYSIECSKTENDKWSVMIPPIRGLSEYTSHPFHLEVIIDGYYFEPHRGAVEFKSEPEVKAFNVHHSQSDDEASEEEEYTEQPSDCNQEEDNSRLSDIIMQQAAQESTKISANTGAERTIQEAIMAFIKKPTKLPKKRPLATLEQDADAVLEAALREVDGMKKSKPKISHLSEAIQRVNKGPELTEKDKKVREILKSHH